MRSLIKTYSIEGRNEAGSPNGQFYLTKKDVEKVSNEVVGTHFGFTCDKKKKYIDSRLPQLWKHFDVNG